MEKRIDYKPNKSNREYLESIQKEFKGKKQFKGLSRIINVLITDHRLKNTPNPFR